MINLRYLIGKAVGAAFILSGARARALRRYDRPGTLLSLCAHDPAPEVLEQLLVWLKQQGFTFYSEAAVLAGKPLPPRAAWLSFDDGWKGFQASLSVLERHQIPVSLFIAPAETKRGFLWTNALMASSSRQEIRALYPLAADLRAARVAAKLKGNVPQTLLTPGEVKRLAAHPLVTVGNHTLSHLSASDRPLEEVETELQAAQDILTDWCGTPPRLFCYPFGHRTVETDALVRKYGLVPVGLLPGTDTVAAFGSFRNMIYDRMSLEENSCRVLKAWLPIRKT